MWAIITKFIPVKDLVYAALIAALLLGGAIAWHRHNVTEQKIGQQKVEAAVAAKTAELTAQNQKELAAQAARDAETLKQEETRYETQLTDSNKLTADLNRRLRQLAAAGNSGQAAVPGNPASGSGANGAPAVAAGVEPAVEGVITAAGHDAAQVVALQDYISNVCLAK